jgi:hypothetical protein
MGEPKMKARYLLFPARRLFLSGCTAALLGTAMPVSAQPPAASCSTAEYRQFDFWLGDWDAFDAADPATPSAHILVERILDGCVIKETYDGAEGQSFTIYDQTRGVWHQTWVTNRDRLLTIEGKLQAGAMVLTGSDLNAQGKQRMIRGTWKAEPGDVRETAVTSTDNGATWTPWFDLVFRPHASTAQPAPKPKP